MTCHFYNFKGVLRRQKEGGRIVLRLTGEVAAIVMPAWDIKARRKIKEAGVSKAMYARYVDDVDHDYGVLPSGTQYNPQTRKVEHNLKKEVMDRGKEDDEIMFSVILDIINTVNPDIQMTGDYPSANPDKTLPVLDMAMFVEDNEVKHTFYSKPMATQYVIPARSVHPERVKRITLTQEEVRRLLNVSRNLPDSERARVKSDFDKKMRFSGYKRPLRWNILTSAYKIYEDKVRQDLTGEPPLYRHREFKRQDRELEKR